jgi:hypothetical protein
MTSIHQRVVAQLRVAPSANETGEQLHISDGDWPISTIAVSRVDGNGNKAGRIAARRQLHRKTGRVNV